MAACPGDVRFTPESGHRDVCFVPIEDIVLANRIRICSVAICNAPSAHERRALGVKFPPWNQKLHGNCVVARAEFHAVVAPMR
jgi:hypothetical protein